MPSPRQTPERVVTDLLTGIIAAPKVVARNVIEALEYGGYAIVDQDEWEGPIIVPGTGVVVEGMRDINPGVWVERDAAGNIATIEVTE